MPCHVGTVKLRFLAIPGKDTSSAVPSLRCAPHILWAPSCGMQKTGRCLGMGRNTHTHSLWDRCYFWLLKTDSQWSTPALGLEVNQNNQGRRLHHTIMKVLQLDITEPGRTSLHSGGSKHLPSHFLFPLSPPTPVTIPFFLLHKKFEEGSFLFCHKITSAFCFYS